MLPPGPPLKSAAVAASDSQLGTLDRSRLLSQPPATRLLTGHSSSRGRLQAGLQIPELFMGPIPELFSASVSPHFQEIQKIMSAPLTRHYFLHFQEMHEIMSTQTQTWHSWLRWGPEKSSGIWKPGWSLPCLMSDLSAAWLLEAATAAEFN